MEIQIKSLSGHLIFEYKCENNTFKKTVVEALSKNADLRRADLSGANLRGADLRRADLSGANLRGADLRFADLRFADLRRADLLGANLSFADLSGADLSGANLRGADLRRADLLGANLSDADLPMYCKWNHSIVNNKIRIGCKLHTIEEWDLFFKSDEIYETKRNTAEFKQIQAVYLGYKAYLTHLKS